MRKEIHGAIRVATPQIRGCQGRVFCSLGEVFRVAHLVGRKIRIVRKKENFIPFAMGSVLDNFLGQCPPVQNIAKFVFGSLSIIRCGEDILELKRLGNRFAACVRGKHYVVVKGDRWSNLKSPIAVGLADRWRWLRRVYCLQLKEAFRSLGLFFRRLFLLGLHLSDVYAAYQEHHVAEVFVYAKDLWHEISSDQSKLVKYLKQTKNLNDWMLMRKNSSFTTSVFLNALILPAKFKQKLQDLADVKKNVDRGVDNLAIKIEAMAERLFPGPDTKYRIYREGSREDPNAARFLSPPKRSVEK